MGYCDVQVCVGLANMHEMNTFMMGLPQRWNWKKWQEKAVKCNPPDADKDKVPPDADKVTKLLDDCKCDIWGNILQLITQIAKQVFNNLKVFSISMLFSGNQLHNRLLWNE